MPERKSARAIPGQANRSRKRQAATLRVHIQDVSGFEPVPSMRRLSGWLRRALAGEARGEISLRIVGEAEGAELNERYRRRRGPTNVLSFAGTDSPSGSPDEARLLGDIVICAPVIAREANEQGKSLDAHWAHIALHGALHLLGYDHEAEREARIMERREAELLAALGFADPYEAEP